MEDYLDLGFCDSVFYKDNYVLVTTYIVMWVGIYYSISGLMAYWVLTQKGTVISQITVKILTNLRNNTY